MREKGLTMTSTLDTTGITHNPDSSSTRYLGAWFDWGAPKGGDAWAKQKAMILGVAQRYGENMRRVLPSFRLACTTALSIMYQRMKTMLTTEPPDQYTLQFVCNKVATTGLRCLNIPAVLSLESHNILTDVMLTPVHMRGAGMENPTSRLCQDSSIGILSGLAHPAPVVRETFNYMMNKTTDFDSADGKGVKWNSVGMWQNYSFTRDRKTAGG